MPTFTYDQAKEPDSIFFAIYITRQILNHVCSIANKNRTKKNEIDIN
jgi:hypothetical protein